MRTILVALLLSLSACAGTIPSDLRQNNKKLAVLSFMGATYNSLQNTKPSAESVVQAVNDVNARLPTMDASDFDYADFYTGSQEKRWQHEIVDWHIDQSVVAKTSALLDAKYELVEFDYDPASLEYEGGYVAFTHYYSEDFAKAIRLQPGFAHAAEIDAYVIILPAQQDFNILDRWSYGIGMARDFLAFAPGQQIGDGVYMLHALYNVVVLDGKTFEQVGATVADHETLFQNRFRGNPAVFVDNSYWADSYESLTDEQRRKITAKIEEMVDATLPRALQKLGLLP